MAKKNAKVIITCAIAGAIHAPTLSAALPYKPEDIARQAIDGANMGSMNFAFHSMVGKVEQWQFPWERAYILNSENFIFRNTFADVARIYQLMSDHGTRYEHECYDIGHLDSRHSRRIRARDRHPGRGARHAGVEGQGASRPVTADARHAIPVLRQLARRNMELSFA